MNNHRFSLQKYKTGSKTTCPHCGHKGCFTRYIDAEGKVQFPDYVGRCDRENKCGYHYPPKEYFAKNPSAYIKVNQSTMSPKLSQPEAKPISYFEKEVFNKTLNCYEKNTLYNWLIKNLDKKKVDELMGMYCIGTAKKWEGSVVFWQIDINGNVRDGKIMLYDDNGHRVKEPFNHITWAVAEMGLTDFNRRQCLFGEHLLALYPDKPVIIVESEKTAIIGAAFYAHGIWLATGGKYGCFNRDAMSVLKNRDVTLIPDLGAETVWEKKADECLTGVARSYTISDAISKLATDEQKMEGLDFADFLLMEYTVEGVLAYMIKKNPYIQTFIHDHNLSLEK